MHPHLKRLADALPRGDTVMSQSAAAWRRAEIGIVLREHLLDARADGDDVAVLAACTTATWYYADVHARTGVTPVLALQRAAADVEAIAVPLVLADRPHLAPLFVDGD